MTSGDPDLHVLTLRLPGAFNDETVRALTAAPSDEGSDIPDVPLSAVAAREGNDHRADWSLQWFFDGRPDIEAFRAFLNSRRLSGLPEILSDDLTCTAVPPTDWLQQSYRRFEPFRESGFYIYGSHIAEPSPGSDIPLQIDAATAFGSGEHGTTAGCLALLAGLRKAGIRPERVLDVGTGSGILAIAAWKLWHCPVTATDIDPEAVRVTERHCAFNAVPPDAIDVFVSDGFAAQRLQQNAAFDLVIANILAGPLAAMACDITRFCKAGGHIMLSGMLQEQAQEIEDLYCGLGCTIAERCPRDPWMSLLLKKT